MAENVVLGQKRVTLGWSRAGRIGGFASISEMKGQKKRDKSFMWNCFL